MNLVFHEYRIETFGQINREDSYRCIKGVQRIVYIIIVSFARLFMK